MKPLPNTNSSIDQLSKAAVALQRCITNHKETWLQDEKIVPELQRIINQIAPLDVTVDSLSTTGMGKLIRSCQKHQNPHIRGYAQSIVKKWKTAIGLAKVDPAAVSRHTRSQEDSSTNTSSESRLALARAKLQKNYANANSRKEARTLQVLTHTPPSRSSSRTKNNPTTVRVSPSRNASLVRTQGRVAINRMRASGASSAFRSLTKNPKAEGERRHRARQEKLRQRAGLDLAVGRAGARVSTSSSASSSSLSWANKNKISNIRQNPLETTERSDMLAKLYPRIRELPATKTSSLGSKAGKTAGTAQKNQVTEWFAGLLVDMSQYAEPFIRQGFDSLAILPTVKSRDIEEMIPKRAHQRIVRQAIANLQQNHSSSKKKRRRSGVTHRRSFDRNEDQYDEEDGFIVNDDDFEYRPGVISDLMHHRGFSRRRYNDASESDASSDMEATYEELQNEEMRRYVSDHNTFVVY